MPHLPSPNSDLRRSPRGAPAPAVVYARCSTDTQDNSIRVQADKINAYLALQNLFTLPELQFADEDVSGRIPIYNRPGGKRAVDTLRCGLDPAVLSPESQALLLTVPPPPTDAPATDAPATDAPATVLPRDLVISHVDRLGRRASHILEFVEWAEQHGYVLHFVDFGGLQFNTHDGMGKLILKMMITLLAMLAEFEVEMTRTRIRNTFATKRAAGELCGKPAYGQRAVEGIGAKGQRVLQAEDDPEELYWLRQMLDWRAAGWSYKRIADHLNALGIPTKHKAGDLVGCRSGGKKPATGRWSQGSVHHALTSQFARRDLVPESLGSSATVIRT